MQPSATVKCPVCARELLLSGPPDAVVGAHLDAGCETGTRSAKATPDSRGTNSQYTGGNGQGEGASVKDSSNNDDDVPLARLARLLPAKRARGSLGLSAGPAGVGDGDPITISSDSDEDVEMHEPCHHSRTARCYEAKTAWATVSPEEERAALEAALEHETAKQLGNATRGPPAEECPIESAFSSSSDCDQGIVMEDEPQDLGEYSRPLHPQYRETSSERGRREARSERNSCTVGPSIIYAPTRREVEGIAQKLKRLGVSAEAYHAGLKPAHLTKVHCGFLRGDVAVVVATVAFGMGINKRNVRNVIHYGWPQVCLGS